jgi:hypothetical protein
LTIAYSVVGIKNYIMLRIFVLELYKENRTDSL